MTNSDSICSETNTRNRWVGILLLVFSTAFPLFAAELGNVAIPVNGVLGGRPVQKGTYVLNIDESPQIPYLQLIKNGKLVATDLAIILPAKGDGKTSVQLTKVAEKEFVRIRARHKDKWFIVYLEKTP